MSTGTLECMNTLDVSPPRIIAEIPRRPCEAMTISSGEPFGMLLACMPHSTCVFSILMSVVIFKNLLRILRRRYIH
jgi:hypothetical protein